MRNWAITIGINRYNNLQALNYAKRDAETVQDFFLDELNFEKVYHFSDDSPDIPQDYGSPISSQPSYATLRRFLRVRFEKPFLQGNDNLWFFFAGHGIRHEERDYLMPFDADPGDVKETSIPISYVTERLRRCGAGNVILFLDACRSQGRRGLGVGNEVQKGVITFFSCSPQESSYEIDQLKQGAFTHALLQGLRVQGEGNCATVERLYQYLCIRVPELNRYYNRPLQTPYPIVEPATKYHLILLPQSATVSDTNTLKLDALKAETARDIELAKQLWIQVLAVSPADMDAIKAIERIARLGKPESPVIESEPKPEEDILQVFNFEVARVDKEGQVFKGEQGQAQSFTEDLGNGVTLDMVAIPGGTFMMGSPEQHKVKVKPFFMGKYAVTQDQWRAVASLPKVNRDLKPEPSHFKGDKRPVELISWYDAVEFCERLSRETGREYRLPSESEWEYACRAGTTTPFHFGPKITPTVANCKPIISKIINPLSGETTEVGSFKITNAFGLYDMHGNVFEWCQDNWHNNYKSAPNDGSAWLSGNSNIKVLRGGAFDTLPRQCHSAFRSRGDPVLSSDGSGFRVACGGART